VVQSVYRGSPIHLPARYEDGNGDLTDPLVPRVDILDAQNTQVIVGAIPTRLSLGIFEYVYTPGALAPLGTWSASWTGTVSGQGLGPILDPFNVLAVGSITPIPNGSYTYDLTTDVGYVRLNIDDRDLSMVSLSAPLEQRSAIFTDEEIGQFISASGNDKNYAVARALMAIANNRALLIQSRRIGRTEVNFGSVRTDLMKAAEAFISLSNSEPADAIAEINYDDFTMRDIIVNTQLRQGL